MCNLSEVLGGIMDKFSKVIRLIGGIKLEGDPGYRIPVEPEELRRLDQLNRAQYERALVGLIINSYIGEDGPITEEDLQSVDIGDIELVVKD